MESINYISKAVIALIILIIVLYGLKEKINVYDVFLEGAKEGIEIVIKIFPALIAIFFAVIALRTSGILEIIINIISPITNLLQIPKEIMPLALLRPISGSASIGAATDIFKTYGVDSTIGLIAATIMGSTETTFYTIAVYSSAIGVKKTRFVLKAALIADIVGMLASVIIWRFMS